MEGNRSTNARCRVLEAYAEECQEHGIQISWRSKTDCGRSFIGIFKIFF